MPELETVSTEHRIAAQFATDLLYAQFMKQAVTTGRVRVPPFPSPSHATKHRVEDVAAFPGGIGKELAEAIAIEEANEQVLEWLKHVFHHGGGAPAPPKPHLSNIIINTSLTFDDPVPVNCSASLSLFPDGAKSVTRKMTSVADCTALIMQLQQALGLRGPRRARRLVFT